MLPDWRLNKLLFRTAEQYNDGCSCLNTTQQHTSLLSVVLTPLLSLTLTSAASRCPTAVKRPSLAATCRGIIWCGEVQNEPRSQRTSKRSEYWLASFPALLSGWWKGKKNSLINTVCTCSGCPGFLRISEISVKSALLHQPLGGMLTLPMMPATDQAVWMMTGEQRRQSALYLKKLSTCLSVQAKCYSTWLR